MSKPKNLIGNKYGRLTVIARAENTKGGKAMWICKCDCGKIKEKPVCTYSLLSGKVRSCGCIYKESNAGRNKTHGKSKTRLYSVWATMKSRCYYPKANEYKNYGGRGIAVCDEWLHDYPAFESWALMNGYVETDVGKCTIDRIDPDGDYSPQNCRWVNMAEQNNNRRNNRIVSYKDEKFTLSELSKLIGISSPVLAYRLNHEWPEEMLDAPVGATNNHKRSNK